MFSALFISIFKERGESFDECDFLAHRETHRDKLVKNP